MKRIIVLTLRAGPSKLDSNPLEHSVPTVLRYGPYRFFFYSGDQDEPPHVHDRDECEAKFWLTPIRLERTRGFKPSEVRDIRAIVEEYEHELLESWNAFFGT